MSDRQRNTSVHQDMTATNASQSIPVSNGLASMGVSLPPAEQRKVTTTYNDMSPMDRFIAETCDGKGQAKPTSGQPASTGQATQGPVAGQHQT